MLATVSVSVASDPAYAQLEQLIASTVANISGPLFTTNADELFGHYLAGIPGDARQHYTCRCCRRFITNYGGLAIIDENGVHSPLFWEGAIPKFFAASAASLARAIRKAKVTGVFINGAKEWGTAQTGVWTHLHGTPSAVFRHATLSASQAMAEKLQDYITLRKGLEDYPLEAAVQAVRVLQADAVDRSEKTLGVAEWFLSLHKAIEGKNGSVRDNLIWRAVALAPVGWCHVRSTMISTLLDDIVAGLPFDAIKAKWDAKMHPLKYQRPIAPPKAGNIEQAEKIIAKLQSEGSLERRFARLEEVTALWKPSAVEVPEKPNGGVFDHLKAKSAIKEVELPAQKMTWEKFRDAVLPDATSVEVFVPHGRTGFFGLVTAVSADAPPILQWDGLPGQPRNPVSWYFYHGGSTAQQWGLQSGQWAKAAAICLKPCHWQSDKFTHQGDGIFFILEGAKEKRAAELCLFPEILKSEYHGIRSVMEAHSRSQKVQDAEHGTANGIALDGIGTLTVRVKGKLGASQDYLLSLR